MIFEGAYVFSRSTSGIHLYNDLKVMVTIFVKIVNNKNKKGNLSDVKNQNYLFTLM